jgi:hypothetical protein
MIDFKLGITWLFDKLGYMPKIDMEVGKVDLKLQDTWPFPAPVEKKKVQVKKATTRPTKKKAAVVAKTARKAKAK